MALGRTHWRRFGVVMLLGAGATAGLLALVANGAVAASFTVSGQQFKVRADELSADGFVQYGTIDARVEPGSDSKTPEPVAVAAMRNATIDHLCQSVVTDLGDFGSVTLKLTAGTGKRKVTAQNMIVDMSQLDGDAEFTDIEIGRDASTLDKGPTNDPAEVAQRRPGFFSQQAGHVVIRDLRQVAWATSAGQFNLYDLSLRLHWGSDECF